MIDLNNDKKFNQFEVSLLEDGKEGEGGKPPIWAYALGCLAMAALALVPVCLLIGVLIG